MRFTCHRKEMEVFGNLHSPAKIIKIYAFNFSIKIVSQNVNI